MHYDEFRDQLKDALQDAGLFLHRIGNPIETIELSGAARRWKLGLLRSSPRNTEPFDVTAQIAFQWDPFDNARSYTCEEDLLTELLGRKKSGLKTVQRFARVDLDLRAGLPYGSTATIPDPKLFGAWTESVSLKLDKLFAERRERAGRLTAILGYLGEVRIDTRCGAGGVLSLTRIIRELSAKCP